MLTGMPVPRAERVATPRQVLLGEPCFLPKPVIISGAKSRDPGNTGDVHTLRAGTVLGKITTGGKYAPAIIGLTGGAIAGADTTITVAAALATEIIRRIGSSGSLKVIGPPTAAGTVRTLTATFSAVGATTVTITALGVASTWTVTAADGTDGGTFKLRVTSNLGTAVSAAIAWNADGAAVDAALEAMASVGTGGVAATGNAGGPWTLTFSSNLGDVQVEVVNDATTDGTVWEGGVVLAQTQAGVDGRFVTSSVLAGTDGSETPRTVVTADTGIKMTDQDEVSEDQPLARLLVQANIRTAGIVNYPADASLKTWLKSQLKAVAPALVFDDDF